MAARRGLGSRVMERQRIDPTTWEGSFPRPAAAHATRARGSGHRAAAFMTDPVHVRNRPETRAAPREPVSRAGSRCRPRPGRSRRPERRWSGPAGRAGDALEGGAVRVRVEHRVMSWPNRSACRTRRPMSTEAAVRPQADGPGGPATAPRPSSRPRADDHVRATITRGCRRSRAGRTRPQRRRAAGCASPGPARPAPCPSCSRCPPRPPAPSPRSFGVPSRRGCPPSRRRPADG